MLRPEQGEVIIPASLQAFKAFSVLSLQRPFPIGKMVPSTSNTTILIFFINAFSKKSSCNEGFSVFLQFFLADYLTAVFPDAVFRDHAPDTGCRIYIGVTAYDRSRIDMRLRPTKVRIRIFLIVSGCFDKVKSRLKPLHDQVK